MLAMHGTEGTRAPEDDDEAAAQGCGSQPIGALSLIPSFIHPDEGPCGAQPEAQLGNSAPAEAQPPATEEAEAEAGQAAAHEAAELPLADGAASPQTATAATEPQSQAEPPLSDSVPALALDKAQVAVASEERASLSPAKAAEAVGGPAEQQPGEGADVALPAELLLQEPQEQQEGQQGPEALGLPAAAGGEDTEMAEAEREQERQPMVQGAGEEMVRLEQQAEEEQLGTGAAAAAEPAAADELVVAVEPAVMATEPSAASPGARAPIAACSRANLQLVVATRTEMQRLVEVEQLVKGFCQASGFTPALSVLSGLVVRFHAAKAYRLSRVAGMQQGADRRVQLVLQDGTHSVIPLVGVSNSSSTADLAAWAKGGRQEAAALEAAMEAAGGRWTPEEVAAAAWRRKLTAAWHAFVAGIDGDQHAELPLLLGRLADSAGIAKLLAQIQLAGGQPGSGARVAGAAGAAQLTSAELGVDQGQARSAGGEAALSGGSLPPGFLRPHRPPPHPVAEGSNATTPREARLLGVAGSFQPPSAFSASLLAAPQAAPGALPQALQQMLAGSVGGLSTEQPGALETLQQILLIAQREQSGAPSATPSLSMPEGSLTPSDAQAAGVGPEAAGQAAPFFALGISPRQQQAGHGSYEVAPKFLSGQHQQLQHDPQQQRLPQLQVRSPGSAAPRQHPQQGAQSHSQLQSQQGGDSARARRRQPITWQPQESEPGDRPLLVPAKLAPQPGGARDAAAGGEAGAAKALERSPQPGSPELTITRTFGAGPGVGAHAPLAKGKSGVVSVEVNAGPELELDEAEEEEEEEEPLPLGVPSLVKTVDASRLRPPSPGELSGAGRAVHEEGGRLTLTLVRGGADSGRGAGPAGSQPGSSQHHQHSASVLDQVEQQQAALQQQLQLLSQLAPGLGMGPDAAGLVPSDLLQMPAHVLLSLYGAQVLQQQLGERQRQVAATLEEAGAGAGGSKAPAGKQAKHAAREDGAGHADKQRGRNDSRGGAGEQQGRHSRGVTVEEEGGSRGRQILIEPSGGGGYSGEARVELRGITDLEGARRHLERLTRHIVPSSAPRSAVQRACMRELLHKGLRQGSKSKRVFVQSAITTAQLGTMLLEAARVSPEVAADYEKYGGQGRVNLLAADLEALGVAEQAKPKPGRNEVLLRIDRLEELAAAADAGGHRSGAKRTRAPSETPVPAPKHARHVSPPPAPAPRGGGGAHAPRGFPYVSTVPTASHRGSPDYGDFWDPIWRFEHAVVRYLRKQGQVPLGELARLFPLPDIYPKPSSWESFRSWLHQRPHLFDISGDLVGAVKGASALLQYKRDMLDYLADPRRPGCRAALEGGLQLDVPLPADTPLHIAEEAQRNFWAFLTKYYGKDVWMIAPKHFTTNLFPLKTVEIRPFLDPHPHPQAPRMNGICRFWEPNRPGSCSKQDMCDFQHCTERPIY